MGWSALIGLERLGGSALIGLERGGSDWCRTEGSDWSNRPPARYWGGELISLASGAVGEGRVLLALARTGSEPLVGCVTKNFCFTKNFVSLNFFFTKNLFH